MRIVESTCGTERMTEAKIIIFDKENTYNVVVNGVLFWEGQQVYGLGFYEEKALKNCLKKVKDKEIVQQIKEQFRI